MFGDLQYILCSLVLIFLIGAKDDIVPMRPSRKFVGQIFAALIMVLKADVRISSFYGLFNVYDVSDKTNPILLNGAETSRRFTHNAWLSDNGKVVFTTDERGNAPVAAYDISDLSDIKFLDEFRPAASIGRGLIPHLLNI